MVYNDDNGCLDVPQLTWSKELKKWLCAKCFERELKKELSNNFNKNYVNQTRKSF